MCAVIYQTTSFDTKLSPFCVNWTLKVQYIILHYKMDVQDKLLRGAGTFVAIQAAVIYNGIIFLQFLNPMLGSTC